MVNKTSPCKQKIKKGINIFSKKGFLRGGHTVAKGGDPKFFFARLRGWPDKGMNNSNGRIKVGTGTE